MCCNPDETEKDAAIGSDVFSHKILDFRFIQFKSKTQMRQRSMLPLAVMCFHTRPWFLLPFSLQWVSADKSRLIQGSTPSLPCPKTLEHRIGGCLVQQIEIQDRTIWHKCVLCQWFRVTCLTFGHLSHNLIQRVGGNSIERSHQYCRTGFDVEH